MFNSELGREIDPAWFQPADNQTEYTQGFYAGRIYERERIIKFIEEKANLVWHTNCTECLNPAPDTWIVLIKGDN
jgi:hypothetical protein